MSKVNNFIVILRKVSYLLENLFLKFPKETYFEFQVENNFDVIEQLEIFDDQIIISFYLENYNWFEYHSIYGFIIDKKDELEILLGKQILLNDFKNRNNESIELEMDMQYKIHNIYFPFDPKNTKVSNLFSVSKKIDVFLETIVKSVTELSKDIESFEKPKIYEINKAKKVFISHSSKDKEIVRKICIDLKAKGLNTWFDEDDILVGQDFVTQIENGIKTSDFLVLILSKNFTNYGPWAKEEYKISLTEQISKNITKILPVVIEDCEIPDFLKSKHYADFREDYSYGLNKIINSIKKLS